MLDNKTINTFSANVEKRLLELKKLRSSSPVPEFELEPVAVQTASSEEIPMQDADLENILQRTACTGWFNPAELIPDSAANKQLLGKLASLCMVDSSGSEVKWFLKQKSRAPVIATMIKNKKVPDRNFADKDDRFGQLLREIIHDGASFKIQGRSQEDLLLILSILETLKDSEDIAKPEITDVRNLLEQGKFLSDYEIMIKDFIGRKDELDRLTRFINEKKQFSWSRLLLTGLGGAGKSALLAKFAYDLADTKKRSAIVVILDFDRPGIDPNDSKWLESEIKNQVAMQVPEAKQIFAEELDEERFSKRSKTSSRYNSSEAQSISRSARSGVLSSVREVFIQFDLLKLPFVLILDTYEEVVQSDLHEKMKQWLLDLEDSLFQLQGKVIFSGRLYDDAAALIRAMGLQDEITVNEFDGPITIDFLVKQNLSPALANQVAQSDLLPKRPLELKLLAKILNRGDATVAELEDEIKGSGPGNEELFSGLIYKRVLSRITEEKINKIAFPGFVLRYLTRDIIQQVLVPALELEPMDDDEADTALRTLKSYTWLTMGGKPDEARHPDELWHRRDLRRSMLRIMISSEPKTSEKIHQLAIDYFKGEMEALYHEMMQYTNPAEGDRFDLNEIRSLNSFLGTDVADLPPPARILSKFATEADLPMHEVECLPNRYLADAYDSTGTRLFLDREYGKAMKLLSRGIEAGIAFDSTKTTYNDLKWEADTAFITVNWDSIPAKNFTFIVPVVETYHLLYPWAIINADGISFGGIVSSLKQLAKSEIKIENEILVSNLCFSLLFYCHEVDKSHPVYNSIQTIATKIASKSKHENPTLDRLLMFLRIAAARKGVAEYYLHPYKLKLDPKWLGDLSEYIIKLNYAQEIPGKLKKISGLIAGASTSTLRSILSGVDGMVKGWFSQPIKSKSDHQFRSDAAEFVRGPDPEFRDICRFALLEAFPDRSSREKLATLIVSVTGFNLPELEPATFASFVQSDPEHCLEIYVELVDRTWNLKVFMKKCLELNPSAEKLKKVLEKYTIWDDYIWKLIKGQN